MAGDSLELQGEISALSLANSVVMSQESSNPLVLVGGLSANPAGESHSHVLPAPSEWLPAPWVCLCAADLSTHWLCFSASGGHFSLCSHLKLVWSTLPSTDFRFIQREWQSSPSLPWEQLLLEQSQQKPVTAEKA